MAYLVTHRDDNGKERTYRTTAKGQRRYDVRYRDPAGKTRTQTFRTREAADKYLTTTAADIVRGAWVDPRAGRVTFRAYAAQWVDTRTTTRGRLAPRTVEMYRHQLAAYLLPTFGDLDLSAITSPTVRDWYAGMVKGAPKSQCAKTYRLLRAILATAVADDLIIRNPCNIKGAGVERSAERTTATPEQVWDAADAMPDHLRAFVLMAAFTGLRFGELAALSRRHVDLLHKTVTVERQLERVGRSTAKALGIERARFAPPKTDAGYRTIAIPPALVPELKAHLGKYAAEGPDGLFFIGPRGGTLATGNFAAPWKKARAAAGLPVDFRFHDLRHTHMTTAAASGASTKELMRRLGQSSPAAALRYQHATDSRDEAIADAVGAALARPAKKKKGGGAEAVPLRPRDGRAMEA